MFCFYQSYKKKHKTSYIIFQHKTIHTSTMGKGIGCDKEMQEKPEISRNA